MQKHLFYIFYPEPFYIYDNKINIKNESIVHRINHVLRLKEKEHCALFNKEEGFQFQISSISKKNIILEAEEQIIQKPLTPLLYLIIPIVLKEQLYDILYSSGIFQVDTIFFVDYDKSYASWKNTPHEIERLETIVASACEQSKNIIFPKYDTTIYSLEEIIEHPMIKNSLKLYIDTDKNDFITYQYLLSVAEKISIFIGPEGGFSDKESDLLNTISDASITLNQSILKTSHACFLSLGILRTLIKNN